MSPVETKRLEVMAGLQTKSITQVEAALRLRISERQVRRLWRRFQHEGTAGIISRNRGKPSNNRISQELVDRALELVAQRYADFGPTFANEKFRELHDVKIGTETLRQAMIHANLWTPKIKRRRKIHPPRERRPQFGELVQINGSPHDWFEGRAPRCSLIVFIDDVTCSPELCRGSVESLGGLQLANELLGSAVAERLVRSKFIVVAPPIFDDQTRMGK